MLPHLVCSALDSAKSRSNNEQLDKRQLVKPPTESQKALVIEEMKPVLNPAARRVKLTYGPYKIKGKEVEIPKEVGMDSSDT